MAHLGFGKQKGDYKCTFEQIAKAIEGSYGVKAVVARRLGVARTAVDRYCKQWIGLQMMLDEEQEKLVDMAEAKIAKLVNDEDFRAIQMVLERKGRKRGWGNHQDLAVQSNVSVRPVIRFDDGREKD